MRTGTSVRVSGTSVDGFSHFCIGSQTSVLPAGVGKLAVPVLAQATMDFCPARVKLQVTTVPDSVQPSKLDPTTQDSTEKNPCSAGEPG